MIEVQGAVRQAIEPVSTVKVRVGTEVGERAATPSVEVLAPAHTD